jgi:enoyl-CoA hydratase
MPNIEVASTSEVVVLHVADGVATVTLNRPEARNALSRELLRQLSSTVKDCEERDDVRVLIVTGADPAFCAGLDLKELASSAELLQQPVASTSVARSRGSLPRGPFPARRKPLIGAINGPAITGGLELALGCDFLIASDRARFADTHARVGVQPNWGLSVLLPQAIGIRRAREMSATGNFIDAETALSWGLVNHVVPHEQLMDTARSIAWDIAGNDPAGVERLLATYTEGSLLSGAEAWQLESRVAATWLASGHGHPDEVARRKQAIIDRGHSQVSGP